MSASPTPGRMVIAPELFSNPEFFRFLDEMVEGVAIVSRDRNFRYTNAACRRILGMSTEQIVGPAPLDRGTQVVGEMSLPLLRDDSPSRRVFRTGQAVFNFPMGLQRPGEDILWMRVNALPVSADSSGEAQFAFITFVEDTYHRLAEDRLRRHAEYFRRTSDGVVVTAPDGRILEWSEGAERLFGYSADEVAACYIYMLHSDTDLKIHMPLLREHLRQRRDWRAELPFRRKDGAEGIADIEVFPVTSPTSELREVHIIYHDVTEQRMATRQAENRAVYLQALADGTAALIHAAGKRTALDQFVRIMGETGGVSRCYIFENSYGASGEWFTSQVAEWCAPGIHPEIDNPDLQNVPYDPVFASLKDVFSRQEEFAARTCDLSEPFRVMLEAQSVKSLLLTPFWVRGQCAGFIGYDDCLSDSPWDHDEVVTLRAAATTLAQAYERWNTEELRDRLEHQLRESHKMEALGRMSGGIAHDFNNLLAAILGYVEDLETRLRDDSGCVRDLREIRLAAKRGSMLIDQLLTFARRRSGERRLVGLEEVAANLLPMLERLVGPKVSIALEGDNELLYVSIDPSQFEQILTNLVVNARDAMEPKGGRIFLQARNLRMNEPSGEGESLLREGDYVCFSVADEGTGIPDDVRDKLFEPFFTTKEVGKGTGIGLAVVYGIVKQAGGRIEVGNRPEGGAEFRVILPAEPRPESRDSNAVFLNNSFRGVVIVCESQEPLRSRIGGVLHDAGFTVFQVDDCIEMEAVIEDLGRMPDYLILGEMASSMHHIASPADPTREFSCECPILLMGTDASRDAVIATLCPKAPLHRIGANPSRDEVLRTLFDIQQRQAQP